jgi:hypothetical protein
MVSKNFSLYKKDRTKREQLRNKKLVFNQASDVIALIKA